MELINWRRAEANLGVSSCYIFLVSVLFHLLNCLKSIYSHIWKGMIQNGGKFTDCRSKELIMLGKQKQPHCENSLTMLSTAHGTVC